jgi:cytosine/adenosine deaminase-related metal-dependent hydrolase
MDFPAPVSPVNTVNPGSSSIDAAVMIPRFEIVNDSIMAYVLSPDLASFPDTTPTFNWQLKFSNESIRERRRNKSSKTDWVIIGAHFQTRTSRHRDHAPAVGPHNSISFW